MSDVCPILVILFHCFQPLLHVMSMCYQCCHHAAALSTKTCCTYLALYLRIKVLRLLATPRVCVSDYIMAVCITQDAQAILL